MNLKHIYPVVAGSIQVDSWYKNEGNCSLFPVKTRSIHHSPVYFALKWVHDVQNNKIQYDIVCEGNLKNTAEKQCLIILIVRKDTLMECYFIFTQSQRCPTFRELKVFTDT